MNSYKINFDLDFKRNPYSGLYIALEGIDGAGKTVQSENLLDYFKNKKAMASIATEPRRTGVIGRVINEFLEKKVKLPAASFQYLVTADRISYLDEFVLPALESGQNIISHRCFWSAIPYGILDKTRGEGSFDVGKTIMVAQSVLSMYHQITIPDITFYLDIPPTVAVERLEKMGIELEYYERLDKLEQVKKGYDWLIKNYPDEFMVIDGNRDPEEIMKDLISKIESYKK